jgi:hypothetical protein
MANLSNITTFFIAAMLSLVLIGCPNCEYSSKCEGNTLVACNVGIDQQFGSEGYNKIPCETPNPICVNTSVNHAMCVMDDANPCDAESQSDCRDGQTVSCIKSFPVTESCGEVQFSEK